jgi:predicted acyltransferase
MTSNTLETPSSANERLLSLDFFRGFTMFLLIAEGTHLFSYMIDPQLKGTIIHFFGTQLHHHPWNGLRFWDLVQPYFMFIVGVAIPFSYAKRSARGAQHKDMVIHAIKRSLLLLFLGWALYCIGPGHITFRFQNVLAQLSVTYLVAFLIQRKSFPTQLLISFAFIGFTELIYRIFWVPGFDQPFTPDANFGAYVDLLISGELSGGHWVSFNAIPTTAHTIWGVLAGKLLMSDRRASDKLKRLLIAGIIGVVAGYALDPVTPIIKRISTSSFVLVSGGWTILTLAFAYWLVDVMNIKRWTIFFAIVGMNPLFIYLFAHVGGGEFLQNIVKPFTMAGFSWISPLFAQVVTGLLVWFLLWYITYWLYKHRIFIKI